jgi:glutathione S-transferase
MTATSATGQVKVYGMDISANVIPEVLFCRDKGCGDFEFKNMMTGELKSPEMLKINAWGQMPSMSDGSFYLAESNAILRYLANAYDISCYGGLDVQERARIDWALDWASTNFSKNWTDIWYPVAGFGTAPADQKEANGKAIENLQKFEAQFLKGQLIGGDKLNIADYKIGTLFWYLNHPAIKKKANFELTPRCKKYAEDWYAALSPSSQKFLEAAKGFFDSKAV